VDKLPTTDREVYSLGIDLYLKWRNSSIVRIRKTEIFQPSWFGDKLSPCWVDKKFFLSTDPKDVHNSSTASVDKMHNHRFLYKE
jgi:hypothetical protein